MTFIILLGVVGYVLFLVVFVFLLKLYAKNEFKPYGKVRSTFSPVGCLHIALCSIVAIALARCVFDAWLALLHYGRKLGSRPSLGHSTCPSWSLCHHCGAKRARAQSHPGHFGKGTGASRPKVSLLFSRSHSVWTVSSCLLFSLWRLTNSLCLYLCR